MHVDVRTWFGSRGHGGGVVVGLAAAVAIGACSSKSNPGPGSSTTPDAGSTVDSGATAEGGDAASGTDGAAADCTPAAGVVATPSCNDVPAACASAASSCTSQPCNAQSPCLALADNTGKTVLDLRMRKLHIAAPATLSVAFVQGTLVDQNVNLQGACCEMGDGGFNVLVRLDTSAKTFTLGGSPPGTGASGADYCFVNQTSEGLSIAPVSAPASMAADGTWQSSIFAQPFNMPIYSHGDVTNLIILPVSAARLGEVAVSADGNCVGSYSSVASCQRWTTSATLSGYITLEDADRVLIPDLGGNSLCTLLTSQPTGATCTRDSSGHITATGDFCSTSDSPATATCADSYWLSATFAASAVTIGDGAGVPQCTGASDAAPE